MRYKLPDNAGLSNRQRNSGELTILLKMRSMPTTAGALNLLWLSDLG